MGISNAYCTLPYLNLPFGDENVYKQMGWDPSQTAMLPSLDKRANKVLVLNLYKY